MKKWFKSLLILVPMSILLMGAYQANIYYGTFTGTNTSYRFTTTTFDAGVASFQTDATNQIVKFGGTNQNLFLPTNAIDGQVFTYISTNINGSGYVTNVYGGNFIVAGIGWTNYCIIGGKNTPTNTYTFICQGVPGMPSTNF